MSVLSHIGGADSVHCWLVQFRFVQSGSAFLKEADTQHRHALLQKFKAIFGRSKQVLSVIR